MDIFCVLLLFVSVLHQVIATNRATVEKMKYHLPNTLKPLEYELVIHPGRFLEDDSNYFSDVVITMKCIGQTDEIILLKKYSTVIEQSSIKVWEVTDNTDRPIHIHAEGLLNARDDIYSIKLTETLIVTKKYKLRMQFSYWYSTGIKIDGYILKNYRNQASYSSSPYLAYTNMDEIGARMVFPGFDQIDLKATFRIKQARRSSEKSISTSKIIKSETITGRSGWHIDEYEELKSISTFSVAFAVTAYDFIKYEPPVPGLEVKLYAEQDTLKLMLEVLQVASNSILFFSKFFHIPFELGKLDLIVAPDEEMDVQDGYGLIILGETSTLKAFDKEEDNFFAKYTMVSKLCHSISRQYFGHMVTMYQWNETLVHHGFNHFLQALCVNESYPTEKFSKETESRFIESYLALLKYEELSVHNQIVPLDQDSFFSKYSKSNETYLKVNHVIAMLSFILGSDKGIFQKCIQNYLKIYRGKNTTSEQTWEVFTNIANADGTNLLPSGITVKDIMDSWLTQKGHPLIRVTKRGSTNDIIVTQRPFSLIDDAASSDDKRCWIVPLSYATKNESKFGKGRMLKWLKCDGKPLVINDAKLTKDGLIIIDSKLNVPLRITYEDSYWEKIRTLLLSENGISHLDSLIRVRFISDMFLLARTEKLEYQFVFETMKYMKKENNYNCWKEASTELFDIRKRWIGTDLLENYETYLQNIMRHPILDKILDSVENYLKKKDSQDLLGKLLLKNNCILDGTECQEFANQLRNEWHPSAIVIVDEIIPQDLRRAIFCVAIKRATKEQWKFLFNAYRPDDKQKNSSNINDDILHALACTDDKTILDEYFNWGIDTRSNHQRKEVFEAVASNKLGFPIIMSFLSKKINNVVNLESFEEFVDYLKIALGSIPNMEYWTLINHMRLTLTNKEIDTELENVLAEATTIAKKNLQWLAKNEDHMLLYLEASKNNVLF